MILDFTAKKTADTIDNFNKAVFNVSHRESPLTIFYLLGLQIVNVRIYDTEKGSDLLQSKP